jgi:hypothetical protein
MKRGAPSILVVSVHSLVWCEPRPQQRHKVPRKDDRGVFFVDDAKGFSEPPDGLAADLGPDVEDATAAAALRASAATFSTNQRDLTFSRIWT